MLTDLKVSTLACKRVFNRPEQHPVGGSKGTEFFMS